MAIFKPANFWKRLLARIIDLFLIAIISISFSILLIGQKNLTSNKLIQFEFQWQFLIWIALTIFLLFLFMVCVPIITKGWTLGMKLFKIKVIVEKKNNFYVAIFKKETPYTILWIVIGILVAILTNNKLIIKLVDLKSRTNDSLANLTNWEKTRLTLLGSFSSFLVFVQMWLAITIFFDKEKRGWHDKWAKIRVVCIKKQSDQISPPIQKTIKPVKTINKAYEWVK